MNAIEIRCALCGAQPGELCRTPDGSPRTFHTLRKRHLLGLTNPAFNEQRSLRERVAEFNYGRMTPPNVTPHIPGDGR